MSVRRFFLYLAGALVLGVSLANPAFAANMESVPTAAWRLHLQGDVLAELVWETERLYTVTMTGHVSALAMDSGRVLWQTDADGPLSAAPVLSGKTLVVASKRGVVSALNPRDGSLRWRQLVDGKVVGTPAIDEGEVYVGTGQRHVYAFDLESGAPRWRYQVDGYKYGGIYSPLKVSGQRLYVGAKNGMLHAIAKRDGEPLWNAELHSAIYDAPLIAGDSLYVGAYDRGIHCLDPEDGRVRWRSELDDWPQGEVLSVHGELYVASRSGRLYALDERDGRIVWVKQMADGFRHAPRLLAGDIAVIGTTDGKLLGVKLPKGTILWEVDAGGELFAAPTPSDKGVVTVTRQGLLTRWRW